MQFSKREPKNQEVAGIANRKRLWKWNTTTLIWGRQHPNLIWSIKSAVRKCFCKRPKSKGQ